MSNQMHHQLEMKADTAPLLEVLSTLHDFLQARHFSLQFLDGVLNLLLNAIDAIDDIGSIKVRVYETLPDKEAGEVVIEVTDTGRGIAPEDLTRIFSPFYTTNPTGTGLGLSAVRGIARAHGGRIEVSSELHQGSTFSLRLPRKSSRVRLPSTS